MRPRACELSLTSPERSLPRYAGLFGSEDFHDVESSNGARGHPDADDNANGNDGDGKTCGLRLLHTCDQRPHEQRRSELSRASQKAVQVSATATERSASEKNKPLIRR